ncbi:acyl carrier protein [Nonomuraea basaltis]|uniref:acyl carrier protein n=1 Tax=Nonomuraea basaltis TaxID=2495887 RepID=UPI00110C52B7|nr:acyl carrier protein [Nonomuraea basaltis]TMR95157.1 acyl carrier protein [Nonomuraea basaltis]
MPANTFTEADLRALLLAVGLGPAQDDYTLTFEQLELDSLARVEIATRIEDRFGLILEIAAEQSPAQVAELVNTSLAGAVS